MVQICTRTQAYDLGFALICMLPCNYQILDESVKPARHKTCVEKSHPFKHPLELVLMRMNLANKPNPEKTCLHNMAAAHDSSNSKVKHAVGCERHCRV